jgi:hypothetical protein
LQHSHCTRLRCRRKVSRPGRLWYRVWKFIYLSIFHLLYNKRAQSDPVETKTMSDWLDSYMLSRLLSRFPRVHHWGRLHGILIYQCLLINLDSGPGALIYKSLSLACHVFYHIFPSVTHTARRWALLGALPLLVQSVYV